MKLGRDVVFDYLRDLGVRYIFGVPGTNEIPLIDGTSIQANDVAYIPCLIAGACVSRLDELQDRLREGLKTVESGQPFVLDVHIDPEVSAGLTRPRLNILTASKENTNDDAIDWIGSLGAP